jgi:hypothetical protein
MTHLLNDDDPQGMVAPQPKLWADYGTPLIQDLWETFTLLWAQTIRPSLKAFYAAVMTAFLKGQSQTSRPARLHPSLSVVCSNTQARKTAVLSETVGLSTESTLSLRRIQGALSDNWAGAPQATS